MKQVQQTLAAAQLAAPLDVLRLLNNVRQTLIFNKKLLYSVFSLVFTWSICFGEKDTSVDNSAPSKNLLNDDD